ncbi:unnamed protein product [Notodromas monacha]|uniref:Uncharacterized protein n=1 Tax=Notodromas monacha TaxID=399045 RepID=A0A7R9BH73_9CRUS|nr:unnamed protein product [Notodromas monacha]CAG0914370.1 unnamed protein product [Notodromas monacha]
MLGRFFEFEVSEQENYDLRLPTFDEHLLNAISYYNMAANVYLEFKQPHLASGVCLEVGNALRAAGKRSEALGYFLQAAEIESKFPLSHLLACQAVVECYVDLGDHEMALNTLTEMGQSLEEQGGEQPAFFEMQSDVEVTSLLILLLLEYPKAHLKTEHRKIMLKFSPDNDDVGSCVHSGSDAENDRRLLLQSLVLAMEMKHFESLKETETQLSKYLNKTQADILHHIVFTSRNRFNLGTS